VQPSPAEQRVARPVLKCWAARRRQVIFFPSRPGYVDPAVTRRVLDYMLFMNSKVLFKQVRAGRPLLRPVLLLNVPPLMTPQLHVSLTQTCTKVQ